MGAPVDGGLGATGPPGEEGEATRSPETEGKVTGRGGPSGRGSPQQGSPKRDFPRRGAVHLVAFDPGVGHEIRKARPAVVVSNDHLNELARTVIVLPLIPGRFGYLHRIPVEPPEGGLARRSSVVSEQIHTVDRRRVGRRLGRIGPETLRRVEDAIRESCGLPEAKILP
jgi:mRNA interferase MazF